MRNVHVKVLAAAAMVVSGLGAAAMAVPTIDGTRDTEYGTPLAVQTVQTQFGDNQSELDAFYASAAGTRMNLFFAGNLESNYNKLVLFLDTKAGGENTILQSSPIYDNYTGIKFDAGFDADYAMIINRGGGNLYVDFFETPTAGGGFGGYAGRISLPDGVPANQQIGSGFLVDGNAGMPSIEVGYNDSNTLGVIGGTDAADQAAAALVDTGFEMAMDLSSLGITSNFKVMAFVNGSGHDYASNQFLPGLPAPQGNLANNGTGGLSNVDLTAFAGDQFVTVNYTAPVNAWAVASGGSWQTATNWTVGVPDGATAQALISGPAGSGSRVITLDAATTVQKITFDNAGASYTIAGPNTLTISASPLLSAVDVNSGTHTISAPVVLTNTSRFETAPGSSLTLSGTLDTQNHDVFITGGGTTSLPAVNMNSITVNAGTAKLTGTGTPVMAAITIDTGATLDIGSAAVVVDYNEFYTPLGTIKPYLQDGRLTSSLLTGHSNRAIGYLDTASSPTVTSYGGVPLDSLALVFVATVKGDATLDKTVNFDDLLALAQNYDSAYDPNANPPKVWAQGDFDYNGIVNFDDLLSLAQNYNGSLLDSSQFSADFAADWALAQSLVPEPTTLAAIGGLTSLVLRRRRSM